MAEVKTPTSQVPFAAGRTSLVGTPARLVDPAARTLDAIGQVAGKERNELNRVQEEQLRQARAEMNVKGTGILESALSDAKNEMDPTRVPEVYETAIGDQLTELKSGITNERDLAAFDISMERRMDVHQLELDAHSLDRVRKNRVGTFIEKRTQALDAADGTNMAAVELAKREIRDMLDEMVEIGAISPEKAEVEFQDFGITTDSQLVSRIAEGGDDDPALFEQAKQVVNDTDLTPHLTPELRSKFTTELDRMISEQQFTELSVEIDRNNPAMLGDSGRKALDELHTAGTLSNTHYRQLVTKQESATASIMKDAGAYKMASDYIEHDIDLNIQSDDFETSMQLVFNDYLEKHPNLSVRQAHLKFNNETGYVAPDFYDSALTMTSLNDEGKAIQGADMLMKLEQNQGPSLARLKRTKSGEQAWKKARIYWKQLYGVEPYEVADSKFSDRKGPTEAFTVGGIRQQILTPEQAMSNTTDILGNTLAGNARAAHRNTLFKQYQNTDEGKELALKAINATMRTGILGFDLEDVNTGFLDALTAGAIENLSNGDTDEGAAFMASAESLSSRGFDASTYNGTREIVRWAPDSVLSSVVDPKTDADLGHLPYVAETNLQIMDGVALSIAGTKAGDVLQDVIQQYAADPLYVRGQGEFGRNRIVGTMRPTMDRIVVTWADQADIKLDKAWEIINRAVWQEEIPGAARWEPTLQGDDMTTRSLSAKQELATPNWLITARTEGGGFIPITSGRDPLGLRMTFGAPGLGPVQQVFISPILAEQRDPFIVKEEEIQKLIDFGSGGRRRAEAFQAETAATREAQTEAREGTPLERFGSLGTGLNERQLQRLSQGGSF